MLAVGQTMYLLIPSSSQSRYLFPGTVLQSEDASFAARFEDPITPEVGSDVNTFCEVRGKFFQQGGVVREIDPTAGNIITFWRTGEVVSAESRQAFRVSVVGVTINADIAKDRSCPVVDVSCEGFGAVTTKKVDVGLVIPIKLRGEGFTIESTARVQTMRERPDGKFRCGFLVPKNNAAARKTLQQLTAAMQRVQLKRLREAA